MTGITVGFGRGLGYLPWQLFVPIIFGLAIFCAYGAVTIKSKPKMINFFWGCLAVAGFLMGIESLANNTSMFAGFLPFIEPLSWVLFCIVIILICIL